MRRAIVTGLAIAVLTASCTAEAPDALVDAGGTGAELMRVSAAPAEPAAPPRHAWTSAPERGPGDVLARQYPAYGVALSFMSTVYAAPKRDARIIGYMRRGAQFRASEEIARRGCARGWFEVPGDGFVCHGDGFALDSRPGTGDAIPAEPTLWDALPYRYGKVVAPHVPQFTHLPTPEEERTAVSALALTDADAGAPTSEATPEALPSGLRLLMEPGFYVSIDAEERDPEDQSRVFVRTIRGGYVRADKLVEAPQPKAIGVALGRRLQLPIAFVYRGGAPRLTRDAVSGEARKIGGEVPLHGAHALTGETVERGGRRYYVTRDGLLLRDTAVRVVQAVARPKLIKPNEQWIRVDLSRQTLTAYEGDTPIFATLVSSGITDHATPTGMFRLHGKHITATMADDLAVDGPYSIEDVPWTMYFNGSYALHGAFWHQRFGHPRSHGCVNLTPRDARWLFFWTQPLLPSAWHGVHPGLGRGTLVVIDAGSDVEPGEQT